MLAASGSVGILFSCSSRFRAPLEDAACLSQPLEVTGRLEQPRPYLLLGFSRSQPLERVRFSLLRRLLKGDGQRICGNQDKARGGRRTVVRLFHAGN
jgi:hypothetical protein